MALKSPPAAPARAGYSGTPLAGKLGVKPASCVFAAGAPEEFRRWLEPLPDGVRFVRQPDRATDLAIVFALRRSDLHKEVARLRTALRPDAAVWTCWPKRASKVATDITEDTIRADALPLGFVDIKVCAVSDVWSGLKLVVRKELR